MWHVKIDSNFVSDESVAPKACAEELGYTFLPCILANLHSAPNLVDLNVVDHEDSVKAGAAPRKFGHRLENSSRELYLTANDVDAVVVPVSHRKQDQHSCPE